MNSKFFPQRPVQNPTIYAYEIIDAKKAIKIHRSVTDESRLKEIGV